MLITAAAKEAISAIDSANPSMKSIGLPMFNISLRKPLTKLPKT